MMPSHVASQFSGGAVRKALALDSTSGIAIAQLSPIAAFDEGRWADAERAYRQVPAGEPLNADLHVRYATYLRVLGRFGDAAHKFHVAHELEPLVRAFAQQDARVLLCAGQYDSALVLTCAGVGVGERSSSAHGLAADALLALGRYDEALQELCFSALIDTDTASAERLGLSRGNPGYDALQSIWVAANLQRVEARAQQGWVSPESRADANAHVGDWPSTYAWLNSGVHVRDVMVTQVGCNTHDNAIRGEPRFQRMATALGAVRALTGSVCSVEPAVTGFDQRCAPPP